jgi:hypothetical protein
MNVVNRQKRKHKHKQEYNPDFKYQTDDTAQHLVWKERWEESRLG